MAVKIIENISISALDKNTARIEWTGDSALRSWVAIDGEWVAQALRHNGTAKAADIPLPTATPRALDLVECGTDETPTPISMRPELRPLVWFDGQPSAASYRVYCQEAGSAERQMAEIGESGADRYAARPAQNLNGENGVWHSFRVTAVDAFGAEETTETKQLYIMDVPPAPNIVEATIINGNAWLYIGEAPDPIISVGPILVYTAGDNLPVIVNEMQLITT